MVIAGAGGHGLEMRHVLIQQGFSDSEICFFDEDENQLQRKEIQGRGIFDQAEIQKHFMSDPRFVLGVGNPTFRENLYHVLTSLGGRIFGIGSDPNSRSPFDSMPYSFIGPETDIGLGTLVNTRAHIHHECSVGEFSDIAPGAMLLGACQIGKKCRIGAGAVILPGIKLGDEVTVGAGAVVVKSFPSDCTLVGIPARKHNSD